MMTSSRPVLEAPLISQTGAVPEEDADALRAILLQLSQVHRRQLTATIAVFGLTLPQYTTLMALNRAAPDHGCTMSGLAEATYQVAATMTGIVDRLAERGLVERRQDSADRRAWRVLLTAQGADLVDAIQDQQRAVTAALLAHFTPDDRAGLLRLLGQYLDALHLALD